MRIIRSSERNMPKGVCPVCHRNMCVNEKDVAHSSAVRRSKCYSVLRVATQLPLVLEAISNFAELSRDEKRRLFRQARS